MDEWLDKLEIVFRQGDIFTTEADALVCTMTVRLTGYGRLGRHLIEIGGAALARDMNEVLEARPTKTLRLGESVRIPAPSPLVNKGIRHLILATLWERENEYTPNLVYKFHINAIRSAFGMDLRSVAFPILHVPRDILAEGIVNVIRDLNHLKDSWRFSIERLLFVSRDPNSLEFLQEYVDGHM